MAELVSVVIKNVYNGGKAYTFEALPMDLSIAELKQRVCDTLEEHPMPAQQRLIHCGKICEDSKRLADILGVLDGALPQTFHLVLSGLALKRTNSAPVEGQRRHEARSGAPWTPPAPPLHRANTTPDRRPVARPAPASAPQRLAEDQHARAMPASQPVPVTPSQPPSSPVPPPSARLLSSSGKSVSFAEETEPRSPQGLSAEEASALQEDLERRSREWAGWYQLYSQAVASSPTATAMHMVFQQQQWMQAQFLLEQQRLQAQCAITYRTQGYVMSAFEASAAAMQLAMSSPSAGVAPSSSALDSASLQALGWPVPMGNTPVAAFGSLSSPGGAARPGGAAVFSVNHVMQEGVAPGRPVDPAAPPPNMPVHAAPDHPRGGPPAHAPAVPAVGAAPLGAPGPDGPRQPWTRLLDLKLALKMIFMVVLLGQDGGPFRLLGLICLASVVFLYQTGILALILARPAPRFGPDGAPLPMAPGTDRRAPIRVRSIIEGGLAPGGGLAMDCTYLIVTFVLSLLPWWHAQPAVPGGGRPIATEPPPPRPEPQQDLVPAVGGQE